MYLFFFLMQNDIPSRYKHVVQNVTYCRIYNNTMFFQLVGNCSFSAYCLKRVERKIKVLDITIKWGEGRLCLQDGGAFAGWLGPHCGKGLAGAVESSMGLIAAPAS